MGGYLFRRDKARLHAQLAKLYATFPVLAGRRREPAGGLSGGQARMLSVAREMMAAPAPLLVPEPTAGPPPAPGHQGFALPQAARRSIGATIPLCGQDDAAAVREG